MGSEPAHRARARWNGTHGFGTPLYSVPLRLHGTRYAHQTRLAVHVTLKMALKQAVRWSLLNSNPAEMVDAPRDLGTHHEEEEIRYLTDEQARHLFASTVGTRWPTTTPLR